MEVFVFSQFSSVSRSCLTLCDPMNRSMPGLPVHHQLQEFKLMCIESVMPSSHLILCCPLLLLPPIPPSIRIFSNESTLCMRWPKYWSFSFSISPSNEHPGLISFRMDWLDPSPLQSKGLSRVFSNTIGQRHQFFSAQRLMYYAFTLSSSWFPEKAMASHSTTLAWKIPWAEEPGGLQTMGSLGVRHDWETSLSLFTFMHWRRKWQPAPVFLPGESQGWGSLVGCHLWGCTESDTTEATWQQQQQQQVGSTW